MKFLALLLLASCLPNLSTTHLNFSDRNTRMRELQESEEFTELKKQVLTPHCIKCHFHEDMKQEENVLLYVEAGLPEKSSLYKSIKSGYMPKHQNPLSPKLMELVKYYIEGIKSNVGEDKETEKFAMLKDEIIVPYCIKCHDQFDREKLILKYISTDDVEKSKLLKSVVSGDMPKKADPLSKEKQKIIRDYIKSIKLSNPSDYR